MREPGETGRQLDWGASLAVTVLPVVRGGPLLLRSGLPLVCLLYPLVPLPQSSGTPTATVASPGTTFGSSGSRVGSFLF